MPRPPTLTSADVMPLPSTLTGADAGARPYGGSLPLMLYTATHNLTLPSFTSFDGGEMVTV